MNLKHQIGESNESMPDPYKMISTDIKAEYQPLTKANMVNTLHTRPGCCFAGEP